MPLPLTGLLPIGSNAGFIFASQAISSTLRAIYAVVLARKLGPELFGLMNYGLGWYAAFLAVANLQLESYMSRQVALDPDRASAVLSKSMTLRIYSTMVVFAVAVAVAAAITSSEDGPLPALLLTFAVAMVGRSAAMWCNSAFISLERAQHVFRIEVAFRVLEVLIGITGLLMGFGLIEIALVHALSWWGQSIYGFAQVQAQLTTVSFRARLHEQLELLRTVLPVAVASVGATWLMQGPFVLFRGEASLPGDLGVVALVLQAFVLLTGVPVALGRAALPALSRTVARTDDKDAIFLGVALRAALAGTAALVIGAAAVGPWMVPIVFGDAYRSAGQHLVYGMMLVLPFGTAAIASQILIAHDKTLQAMVAAVLGAAAMTVIVRGFMPGNGAIAAYFLCIFAGITVWSALALVLLSRSISVNWRQWLVKPAVASALSIGLYYILVGVIGTGGSLVVAMLVLLTGQRAFNIVDRQERAELSRYALARLGRRTSPE